MTQDDPADGVAAAQGPGVRVYPDGLVPASRLDAVCDRHFLWLAAGVLSLALFNLAFRIDREIVMTWDESLYATTAWEMVKSGEWVLTTFLGQPDYYNTKPPLNVWLIALSFKAFGVSLVSLRVPCVLSAWTTVAVMVFWVRRSVGSAAGILTGLVLSTSFGFIYVHAGRNANTDATFTLLFVLMIFVLWTSYGAPRRAVWIGPLLAATFLLRGPAALMFAVVIGIYWAAHQNWLRGGARVIALAAVLCLAPVLAWAITRWRIDQGRFFHGMFYYDLLARTAGPLEGHSGSPFYYLNILAKHQYDWLLAACTAVLVVPGWHRRIAPVLRRWRQTPFTIAVSVWAVAGLAVPTILQTKVPWYLNHSYPVFAVGVASLLAHAFRAVPQPRRRLVLLVVTVVALVTAESKLISYSYRYRDLSHSPQGLLLGARDALAGHRVYSSEWDRSDMFLLAAIIGAERGLAWGEEAFLAQSQPGDFILSQSPYNDERLTLAATGGRHWLYRRER
jgi:4-amino-4-deoxy-L-arabinose transferase-like glycosyltransferase